MNFIWVKVRVPPPQAVKSILVCMANRVRAKTTPAVIPTAISTSVTSYVEQMAPEFHLKSAAYFETLPISQPSHSVNSPRKMRLWGLFLLMDGTQTRASIMMMEKARATQSKAGFSWENLATVGMKKNPMKPIVTISCTVRIEYTCK